MERLGAWKNQEGKTSFRVWAPYIRDLEVLVATSKDKPAKSFSLSKNQEGYFTGTFDLSPEARLYKFKLDHDQEIPDPASRYQPFGSLDYSEIYLDNFKWTDHEWQSVDFREWVIYEIHVGTFSEEGTFAGVQNKIPYLKKLGINAIELMPIAQFSGKWNWGYDGVGLYAPQNSYGSKKAPDELKSLVNECHRQGIAVILDVVYNHLGPEGNFLPLLGPYFKKDTQNAWGDVLNFDGADSDHVRQYFLNNARQWLEEFHFDGLRLDAVHAIHDQSAKPFLEELAVLAEEIKTKHHHPCYLIAESESNDSRLIKSRAEGGIGLDGHWADDLHHIVHTLTTKEDQSYYQDYGQKEQLEKIFQRGILFQGEYSKAKQRRHGREYSKNMRHRLVVCSQNHDQIGNRKDGERLISMVGTQKQKWAAACIFLSGAMPLIFMGEEYGETAPFLYFVDHIDEKLRQAVRDGRKKEFAEFRWEGETPDPASFTTVKKSRLNWDLVKNQEGQGLLEFYRQLIQASKWLRQEKFYEEGEIQTQWVSTDILQVILKKYKNQVEIYFSMADGERRIKIPWADRDITLLATSQPVDLKQDHTLEPFGFVAFHYGVKEV